MAVIIVVLVMNVALIMTRLSIVLQINLMPIIMIMMGMALEVVYLMNIYALIMLV